MSKPAQTAPININLANQDDFSNSLTGKFLLWALSIGRYIVVFTELIVILSFLSRFKLDRELTDLNEEISRYKAIVLSYGNLEETIKDIQKRTELVQKVNAGTRPAQAFTLLETSMPPDIKLEKIAFTQKAISLTAEALSPQGFALFINRLTANDLVDHLEIGEVSSQDQNQSIKFAITIALKNEPVSLTE